MIDYSNNYKYLEKCTEGFYSPQRITTYRRPVNVVTGSRSLGKSTGVAILVLLDYIKNGHKFMYVRRHQNDTYKTCKTFFSNAISIINDAPIDIHIYGFKFYNGDYQICLRYFDETDKDDPPEWEQCGKAFPLAQEEQLKSSVFSEYFTIIYDEFISKDPNKYLGTKDNQDAEWNALTSLYQTIDRGVGKPFRNETAIFLLANKATLYNPIFLTLNIVDYVNNGANFTAPKNEIWVWEDVKDVYNHEQEKSFGYMMSTQKTKDYAYKNKGDDSTAFVKKFNNINVRYLGTVLFKGDAYGFYMGITDRNMYIGKAREDYRGAALDLESHDGNALTLIRKWQELPLLQIAAEMYKRGALYFNNGKTQALFLKYLQFMP